MIYSTTFIERTIWGDSNKKSSSFFSAKIYLSHVVYTMIVDREIINCRCPKSELSHPINDVVGFWESYYCLTVDLPASSKLFEFIQNHEEECFIYRGSRNTFIISPSTSFLDSFETMIKLGYFDE